MANKARYYGLSTKEDKDAVNMGSGVLKPNNGILDYEVVATAIRKYKANHPNFDNLTKEVAASEIAKVLTDSGFYGEVDAHGARIEGGANNYSVALTKGRGTDGQLRLSRASEEVKKKKET